MNQQVPDLLFLQSRLRQSSPTSGADIERLNWFTTYFRCPRLGTLPQSVIVGAKQTSSKRRCPALSPNESSFATPHPCLLLRRTLRRLEELLVLHREECVPRGPRSERARNGKELTIYDRITMKNLLVGVVEVGCLLLAI